MNEYLLWYVDNDKMNIHVRNMILKKLNDPISRPVDRLIIASMLYPLRHHHNRYLV
jgi:hypothetical protein